MIPKFRAWYQGDMWIVINIRWKNDGIVLDLFNRSTRVYCIPGDLCFLLQSTGLKDKNGTEIFEGDVFKSLSMLGTVTMKEGCWICDWHKRPNALAEKLYPHIEEGEVVGNIHQHPELLK